MDRARFWDLVFLSCAWADEGMESQAAHLVGVLDDLPVSELVDFDAHFVAASRALYTWDVLGAATAILGRVSDDAFSNFRSWVVAQGRPTHEKVVAGADSLADLFDIDLEEVGSADLFASAAREAYESRTGGDWFEDFPGQESAEPDEPPAGTPFDLTDLEELRRRYPQLAPLWILDVAAPAQQGRPGALPLRLLEAEHALLTDDVPDGSDGEPRPPVSQVLVDAVEAVGLAVQFVSETSTDPRHRAAHLLTGQGPALTAEVATHVDAAAADADLDASRADHAEQLGPDETLHDLDGTADVAERGFRRTGHGITLVRARRGAVVVEAQVSAYLPDPRVPSPTADDVARRLLYRFAARS